MFPDVVVWMAFEHLPISLWTPVHKARRRAICGHHDLHASGHVLQVSRPVLSLGIPFCHISIYRTLFILESHRYQTNHICNLNLLDLPHTTGHY